MTNEKDKSAGYDLAIDWTQSLSGNGIQTDEIAHLGARIADLLATVRAEEREAAFKDAIEIAKAELIPNAGAGSADEDFNAATQDVIVALERALTENRKGEG